MQKFESNGEVYAVYVSSPTPDPVEFYTDTEDSIQVGAFRRDAGYSVPRHAHLTQYRPSGVCQEVILVRSGVLRVTVWSSDETESASWTVRAGEMVVLLGGWHAVEVGENCVFFEVKTGPYSASAKVYRHPTQE